MDFVSFHTHTTHSHGDGFGTVAQHIHRVAELGMTAVAFTEHGNLNSAVDGERRANEAGVRFIPGIEAYFAPPGERSKFHIGLIAMNEEGYRNLNKIVTQSWLDFYQFPTVTWENLKEHNAGITVLSGCSDSLISCTLLGGKSLGKQRETIRNEDYRSALRRIQRFTDVFTTDRFFLEVQRFPRLGRTCTLNPALAKLAKRTGVRLLATADVHYPYGYQNEMQKILHVSRRKSSITVADAEWEYDILLTYPTSDQDIIDDLQATGLSESETMQAVSNTTELAEVCHVELPKARPLRFPVPSGTNARRALNAAIMAGWQRRIRQRRELVGRVDEYQERIRMEYKVIREKDFVDFFLATADLVEWAKAQGIAVGPGRGSAVSSLICYLLGITEIDPLTPPFDKTIFERFLDPTRSDPPDIDLDFDDEKRHLVSERARELYGREHVASVGNHTRYRGKSALASIARAYGLPVKTFDHIGKRISDRTETDDRVDDSIKDVLESYSSDPEVADLAEAFPDHLRQAMALEGNQHSLGIHAGGFVISSEPIPEVCAIYTRQKGTGRNRELAQVIPYDKRDAEYLGMLKMDFLGLTTMGMIGQCIDWGTITLDELYTLFYRTVPLEQALVIDVFQSDDVTGIFQYEGGTTRALTRRVKPATFDQLAICNALSRPGPYYGRGRDKLTQADKYCLVNNGEMDWERIHPNYDQHVEWTNGQIVYQEQIMRILRDLSGFSVPEVLRVRKIIGKKLGEHQFRALWDRFRDGCAATSAIGPEKAQDVWGSITTAAGYAFNIPHSYSYALIAWWQAYLKIHNPIEFYAASLSRNGDGKDDLSRRTALLQDAERKGLKIKPFDASLCEQNWMPGSDGLQPGLMQIPGIAAATASDMLKWRDEQALTVEWDEYQAVKGIGEKTIASIKSFAAQSDPLGIHRTEDQIMAFRKQLARGDFNSTGVPSADEFFTSATVSENNDSVAFVGLVSNIVYRDEIESIRSRTGQTVDEIKAGLDDSDLTKKAVLFAYDEFGDIALRVSRWALPRLASRLAQIKTDYHLVVAWGRTFENKNGAIQLKNIWVFDPD